MNKVIFGDSGSTAFGYNNVSTEFDVREISVTNSGISVVGTIADNMGVLKGDVEYSNSLLFFTNGHIYNIETNEVLTPLSFSGNNQLAKIEPDPDIDSLYSFVDGYGQPPAVEVFEIGSAVKTNTIKLPELNNIYPPRALFRIGHGRLAAVSGDGLIVVDIANMQ